MPARKSISLMLWARCTLTALSIFCLIGFDLDCFLFQHSNLSLLFCVSFPREELKLCRQNVESLVEQRDKLEKDIERQRAEDNRCVQNSYWSVLYIHIWDVSVLPYPCVFHSLFISFCSVAVFQLRAQHKNLCQKLQSEEELEGHINTRLKQQEWVRKENGLTVKSCSDRL